MYQPSLIEPNVKNYLFSTLQTCHTNRVNIYFYALNISIFIIFSIITGFILYRCYTQKPSEYEKQRKLIKDQEYVLSKIRYYQDERKMNEESQYSTISNLPIMHG